MSLAKLTTKKRLVVLGLNSGTSADALDMAAVSVSASGTRPQFLQGDVFRFSRALQARIHSVGAAAAVDLEELVRLHNYLGDYFGRHARRFADRLVRAGIKVDLIASHGQTVRHLPLPKRFLDRTLRGSLQLGALDFISARTGLVTVGDFRQADIAAGGEGAPITTGAMARLFADSSRSRLLVNIGGMANYFYFPAPRSKRKLQASDCGPGNSLSDILCNRLFAKRYDLDGRLAARGQVSQRLLSMLLGKSFGTKGQVSTGREQFGEKLAEELLRLAKSLRLKKHDVLRTIAEFTTLSIATSVWPLIKSDSALSELYLTGGGRHNRFLVERLRRHLPDVRIGFVDELGVDGDLVEAASFALLGAACLRSQGMTLTTGGGSRTVTPVAGHIVQPPVTTTRSGR